MKKVALSLVFAVMLLASSATFANDKCDKSKKANCCKKDLPCKNVEKSCCKK